MEVHIDTENRGRILSKRVQYNTDPSGQIMEIMKRISKDELTIPDLGNIKGYVNQLKMHYIAKDERLIMVSTDTNAWAAKIELYPFDNTISKSDNLPYDHIVFLDGYTYKIEEKCFIDDVLLQEMINKWNDMFPNHDGEIRVIYCRNKNIDSSLYEIAGSDYILKQFGEPLN